jgi:hypothetical protein
VEKRRLETPGMRNGVAHCEYLKGR